MLVIQFKDSAAVNCAFVHYCLSFSVQLLNLNQQDLSLRVVDHVDIAAPAPAADAWYVEVGKDEPAEFVSKKTGRGPLKEGWQVRTYTLLQVHRGRFTGGSEVVLRSSCGVVPAEGRKGVALGRLSFSCICGYFKV